MSGALAVYVHLPWCVRRCPYCDFNAHALRGALPATEYIDALLSDLDDDTDRLAELEHTATVGTVFFGGGTPSLFPPAEIARLIEGLGARLDLSTDVEITLEANPGTTERSRFEDLRSAGINRLSLGIQSFDDSRLEAIGRIHDGRDALNAAAEALETFDAVNLDLMFGLPEQTEDGAIADIERAIDLGPNHISHYQLTLEPGTVFHRRPPPLPDPDACWAMQEACEARLTEAGFEHYEISAWAKPGARCRHNLNYWRYGDYLGLGAGAHGKLTDAGSQRIWRSIRETQPRRYLECGTANWTEVPAGDLRFEFMLNVLRLCDGFTLADYRRTTGLPAEGLETELSELASQGLMATSGDVWRPSERGRRFLNDLQAHFLPPASTPRTCTDSRGGVT